MSRIMKTGLISGLAISALFLAGCSTTSVPTEDAASESTASGPSSITVYTSEPQEKIDELVELFNTENPEITVEVFRAGTGDLTARIESERTAGAIQADILLAADAGTFEGYAAEDLLLKYTPADIEAINPEVVDPEGFYTGTRIIPTVIAYNTTLIDSPPKAWKDLTDAQYAGKIAMPNPDVSGAAAYNAAVWLDEPALGLSWLTALAGNKPVILDSNGPVSQAVATGTQPVGVVVDYLVRELADAGSPIAVAYPSEGVPYVSQPVGIFADSKQPASAQAFVDFLVSKKGQTLAVEQNYLPIRSDAGSPKGAPKLDEIKTLAPDLETIQKTQDGAVETFNGLFQ